MAIFHLLILIAGLFILGKSAQFVVATVSRIGHSLRLSEFVTGFVILGIATSIPEISIGLNSIISRTPQLSLGNLFGANVVLLTLIAGLAAILNRGITIKQELSHWQRLVQIAFLIISPLVLLYDSHLSRVDGLILIFLYAVYFVHLYRLHPTDSPPLAHVITNNHTLHTALLAVVGFLGVLISSKAVVAASLNLAQLANLPSTAIGILILSLGTNLPEISVVLAAIRHRHPSLVIGDVLGSASTNTLVIAFLALFSPFSIREWQVFRVTAVFMVSSLLVFFFLTRTKNRLTSLEGALLLAFYIGFLASGILSLYLPRL